MCARGSVRGVSLSAMALTATLLVLLAGGAAAVRCPPKCLCFRTTVRCMFLGLKRIPHVPHKTTILDLRFNKIRTIPPNHLKDLKGLHTLLLNNNHISRLQNGSFTGLESLRYLYLYKNRIRVIEKQVFQGLDKLEQLYLHFNDLATFEADTFSNLTSLERLFLHNNRLQRVPKGAFSNLHSLRRLRLDSNALVCDCQLMWLAQMVKEKQHTTQVAATCQFPSGLQGKSLTSLNDSEFQCRGKPLIKEGPTDVDVRFGGTAYFTCKVEGDPEPEVIWFHNNEVISDNDRYNILTDGTLMIENAQDEDVGYYECMATNPMGEVKSRKAKMAPHEQQNEAGSEDFLVSAKPRFLLVPSDVNVTEGSPVEIECQASGIPKPHIVWTRNDEPIIEGPRIQISSRGAFSISSAERNDSAIYRCTAANHRGRISASATLTVLIPPRLTVEPDDKYASPGTSIQFTCRADGVPPPIIAWFKDGQPIVPFGGLTVSLRGISLGVQHVKPSDEGEYICRAQNPAGMQEASATLYVRDKVAPVIRKEPRDTSSVSGQEVIILPCKADGRPKPVISWRKDGHILESNNKHRIESDGSLSVYNVTQDDAGIYECSAQNHVGYATAQARVTVQGDQRPHIGDQFLHQSFEEARQQVNRAVNDTISQLFQRDRSRSPHPHELLRIFRFPSEDGREIARATEMIEQTLKIVMRHVESGMVFNLTSFSYQDLLSPEKLLLLRNLSGCLAHRRTVYCDDMCFHSKYRTIDGTCNNLRNPLWGASLTGFRRVLNPIYENGFNTPVGWSKTKQYYGFFKPSARLVSSRIISTEEVTPDHHCTHMLMQWGQFLDHDIDHALPSISSESFHDGMNCQRSCDYASPCFPIEIPTDDPRIRHHRCMEFTRSSGICGSGMTSVFFNTVLPREQINQLTSYIDASQVYGSSAVEMRLLRNLSHDHGSLRDGILMSTGKPLMPFSEGAPVDCRRDLSESGIDCFLAGDIRANEQSGLTAMHTVWFREHNRIAEALRQINPHWDGDTVFYEARKIVGAEMQHITYTHWLPHIIGPQGMEQLGEYSMYNPKIEPTISNVFATAAYRFGHSLINPILHRLNATFQPIPEGHLPLHKAFFSPWRIVQEGGIDPLLRGLFATPAKLKMPGQFVNTELTEKLFRAAQEVALDLASLNIQRGRDHALPGYSDWRRACNLSVPENFDELSSHISSNHIRNKLQQLYGHPGNVDLWVGGLLEDPTEGARVGPTFLCLLVDQFRRLRDGDRFWYENPSIFKREQLAQIKQVTLGRVMCDNGDDIKDVTPDVFVLPREQKPAFVQCSDIPYVDLRLWTECCTDCRNAGNFNSLTQTPGIRFRRQAEFSHVEDREHILMGITKGKEAKSESGATLSFSSNNSDNDTYFEHGERMIKPKLDHSHRQDEVRDWVPKSRNSEVNSDDDFGSYMQDMTEQRIEGIEVLVEHLTNTVSELNKKVSILELKCNGRIRKRRRKVCHDENGHERRHGETWQKSPCTTCKCRRGNVQCQVTECSL
ncbi:peroxidasin homolog isoform X1 [Panulirus ornatus]|uniref:peroxidasin homolog isoform X1 n=1 Tax=Panulirus ornatus TaxID=150431 RepID=UPI003A86C9DB